MTTREQSIAAAKECFDCLADGRGRTDYSADEHGIEKFYAIAFEAGRKSVDTPVALAEAYRCGEEAGRVAEREECAKVCENNYWSEEIDWWLRATKKDVSAKAARKCAEAIRARGATK